MDVCVEVSELSLAGEDRAGRWGDPEAHIFPARLVESRQHGAILGPYQGLPSPKADGRDEG